MSQPLSFEAPADEPLSIHETSGEGALTASRAVSRGYEFSCRGDRVPLAVWTPESDPPHALLLLQPAPGDSGALASRDELDMWLDAGVAIASIELPLFGSRRSEKLSEKLSQSVTAAARGDRIDETGELLWQEFTRQAVMELRRAMDVVNEVWRREPRAIAFAGVGIGASLGTLLCAVDERPGGAVLALTGGGFGPETIDPTGFVAAIAPRPLLFVNEEAAKPRPGAPAIPKDRAIELHEAARDPKQVSWQQGNSPKTLDPASKFLSDLLRAG
jgi:hypothetical protein